MGGRTWSRRNRKRTRPVPSRSRTAVSERRRSDASSRRCVAAAFPPSSTSEFEGGGSLPRGSCTNLTDRPAPRCEGDFGRKEQSMSRATAEALDDRTSDRLEHALYPRSRALYEAALRIIPGAHHLSGRPLLGVEDSPHYMERGKGSRVWDVDGNEYIDFVMAYGPFLLGYANDTVDSAVFAQARRGNLLSLNHPIHLEFAERLIRRCPSADMAIAFKTGSDATPAALRIARRHTRRRRVARCGYH